MVSFYLPSPILLLWSLILFVAAVGGSSEFSVIHSLQKRELDPTCAEASMPILKRLLNEVKDCSDSMNFESKRDRTNKIHCILRCVLHKERFLNDEGQLERSNLDTYLANNIPSSMVPKAKPLFNACFDIGHGKLDPAENLCKSYKPLIKCLMDLFADVCKEPKPK